jgi:hypothetical protein
MVHRSWPVANLNTINQGERINTHKLRLDTGFVIAAIITGLVLRVGTVLFLQTYQGDPGAYEHAYIAAALARGEGFVFKFLSDHPIPSSHQAPAMPLLLALCFRVAGVGTSEAYLTMELFNVALAAVGIWAIGRIGATLWNELIGFLAAWGLAIYPPLVYAVTRVQAVTWSTTFLLLSVYCVLRLSAVRTIRVAVGTGVCLAMGETRRACVAGASTRGFGTVVEAERALGASGGRGNGDHIAAMDGAQRCGARPAGRHQVNLLVRLLGGEQSAVQRIGRDADVARDYAAVKLVAFG